MKKVIFFSFIILLIIFLNGCKKNDVVPTPILKNQLMGKTTAVFNPNITYGTLTDQDGNVYKTITICSKTWMAENLRTTKYRDGSTIPEVTVDTVWSALTTNAFCNYNNTRDPDTIATYGRLYNWYAVSDIRSLAPEGWHVATDAEWTQLTDCLGGEITAGIKLKEIDTLHWLYPNTGATNEYGFTALPSGGCGGNASFDEMGSGVYWWSATERSMENAYIRSIHYVYGNVNKDYYNKNFGFAVRCVKD